MRMTLLAFVAVLNAVPSVIAVEAAGNEAALRRELQELKLLTRTLLERIEALETRLEAPADPPGGTAQTAPLPEMSGPPIGLDGYCPVTLCQRQRWVRGDARYIAVHGWRTYRFAGQDDRRRFLADPRRFAPLFSGYDPVMAVTEKKLSDGRREYGDYFGERVILFSSDNTRQQFESNPNKYAGEAAEAAVSALLQQELAQTAKNREAAAHGETEPEFMPLPRGLTPRSTNVSPSRQRHCRRFRIGRRRW